LIRGRQDWAHAWVGAIPLVIMVIATLILVKLGILTWADPLAQAKIGDEAQAAADVKAEELRNLAAASASPPTVVAAGTKPASGGKQAWDASNT